METLQIGARTKQVPSTWNEMRRQQLLSALALLHGPIYHAGSRLEWLAVVTGFPLLLLTGLPADVLAQLLPLVNFLTSEDHLLTAQLLPTLRIPGRHRTEPWQTWHGPRASLSNVTFGEFIFADTFFVLHALHRRPAHLDQFLAVLYRPSKRNPDPDHPDWDGDVRVRFNEHQLEHRTRLLEGMTNELEKLAVLTWYRGCRQQLATEFPDVFAEAETGTPAARQAPQWERVLRKFAGGAFGPVQQTAGQPLRLLLAEMQDAAVRYHQQKPINPSF